ncbi:MAG: aspartate/glutamate racemase family protein, partial [Candidatus Thorarchaeota archaeon]
DKNKTIGIVGGVGPEASNKFCEFLIKLKTTKTDQENLRFIHFCNPQIPDRTDFIVGKGPDPTPELIKTCLNLESSGADFLVIPCNTAHYFLPEIQESVNIPIIDMTKVLVKSVLEMNPNLRKIGILATTGSLIAGIYEKYFKTVGIEVVLPSSEDQETLVMSSIYGRSGIKAGKKIIPKRKLTEIAYKLIESGAEALVLGCTEIPLVLKQRDFNIKLFDPMELTAKEIIKYVEGKESSTVITVKYSLERSEVIEEEVEVILE